MVPNRATHHIKEEHCPEVGQDFRSVITTVAIKEVCKLQIVLATFKNPRRKYRRAFTLNGLIDPFVANEV